MNHKKAGLSFHVISTLKHKTITMILRYCRTEYHHAYTLNQAGKFILVHGGIQTCRVWVTSRKHRIIVNNQKGHYALFQSTILIGHKIQLTDIMIVICA